MDHGKIVAMGTTEEIIQQHGSGERLEIHGSEKLADYIKANTELQVDYDKVKGEITIPLKKKIDALAALAAAEQSGMDWGEIQTRQDSFDDVFVKLVSEPIGEQGETVPERRNRQKTEALNMVSGKRIYSDFKVFSRGYLRNKFGLFFGLIFPVILILIFGAIFSGGNAGKVNVYAQNQDYRTVYNPQDKISDRSFLEALKRIGTIHSNNGGCFRELSRVPGRSFSVRGHS